MTINIRGVRADVVKAPQNMYVLRTIPIDYRQRMVLRDFSDFIGARILRDNPIFEAEMTGDTREHLLDIKLEAFNAANGAAGDSWMLRNAYAFEAEAAGNITASPAASDSWFQTGKCDRCGKSTDTATGSRFNTEMCCPDCIEQEKQHPKYKEACDTELAAVKAGDYNFPGIGLPDDLRTK